MKGMLMKNKYGFSLIELMVVIVIVIILALALTPLFKEEIEKARYSEGISALGALNTKIKVYVAENNALPRLGYSLASSDVVNADGTPAGLTRTVRLVNSERDVYAFLASGEDSNAGHTNKSRAHIDLGISLTEYEGRYFKQDHYQYCNVVDNLSSNGTYMYAVAVVGGGGSGGADLSKAGPGSYYAVAVRQTTNDFITVVKSDYSPVDKREKRLVPDGGGGLSESAIDRGIELFPFTASAATIAQNEWK